MKRNARNSFLLLILIFSLLLVSCEGAIGNSNKGTTADTNETIPPPIGCETAYSNPEEYAKKDHSAFKGSNAIVVEWGDILEIGYTTAAPTKLSSAKNDISYALVAVKFIKPFYSTVDSCEDETLDRYIDGWSNNGEHSYAYTLLNESIRSEISKNYDDVLFIPYNSINAIEKGRTDLIFLESDTILFPHKCTDDNCYWLSDYHEIRVSTVCKRRYDDKAVLYPIIDGKVAFGDEFLEKDLGGYYIDPYVDTIIETNEYLLELGYEDNLFYDGMTVDELEEYFDLVTKMITFAPLFGDYLEAPYWKYEDTAFVGLYAMIVEWGDVLNIEGCEEGYSIFTNSLGKQSYALVSVKVIKFFSGTTSNQYFTEDSTINDFYGKNPRDEKHSHLYKLLDEGIQSEISEYYDDVFVIPYENIDLVKKGRSNLVFLRSDGIIFPHNCTDDNCGHSEEYEKLPAYTVELRYDNQPALIPIIDGKVSIDTETLERIKIGNYFRYPDNCFSKTNDYLIELGHEELIFCNGMTIDELDRYFKVVIKN